MNFFKFLKALRPGTVIYWDTANMILISCGCQPLYKRILYGLTLKSELLGYKVELAKVHNLKGMTIIGKL